ncbi:uncharacterized protein SPAPADRAFT_51635 [Spathaspora passalidarum NRRL Y-27907]|uniref:Uncharacterized protein n=1 Tax=Spathaspora passalidarum (strain NRRL Y-27907 / 11-Y1) TaxID=619300 RepID=G3AQU7_SPAPN|nr:uncharacterized protein SPAPADRAFT_51635 [Spathaspora passalidarum NRRL Y-27907]EGW31644.1 hypothetical protein SPAPADRAFT_51635 [Spathaspora passalidarum NRRL Y-27907]
MFNKLIGVTYIRNKLAHSNSTPSIPQEPSPSRTSTSSQRPRINSKAVSSSTDQVPKHKSKKHKKPTTINRAQVQQSIPSSMALAGRVRHSSSPVVPTIHTEFITALSPAQSRSSSASNSSSISYSAVEGSPTNANYITTNSHMFDGTDNFLFSHDLTIDMNLKKVNTNLSASGGTSLNATSNINDDMWSYNPEEGHTVYVSDKKKSVRFS